METENNVNIRTLLTKWKLDNFIDKFEEQKITPNVLYILKPHHLEKLLEDFPIGDQAIFEENLEDFKNGKNLPQQPNYFQKPIVNSISVLEILNQTYNGKEILNFYAKNNVLHEEQRNLLINTITKYIEANGNQCSISDCANIEAEICSIFPTEQLDFYSNGKRGKIYNKLNYLKRLNKEIFKYDEITPIDNNEPDLEDCSFYILQIKSGSVTADEFDLYWRKCAGYRFKQISETNNTSEIFKLWPEYAKPSGFQLIDIDFTLKFPNAKSLHERWSQFGKNIFLLLKMKISNSTISKHLQMADTIDEESKIFLTFWYLHNIFPPPQKVKADENGAKIRKKFSIADSQEGFTLIATTMEEIDTKIKLLKLQSKSIQPKLLIVGEILNIKEIYVYLDDVKYPILTILNAIDILFKILFVFNLKYPEESEVFYNFIESFLYDLPCSKKYSKISAIKHDLLNM